MLKLSENKTALVNLDNTIKALDTLNYLIKEYQQDKAGPAYCNFDYVAVDHSKVQIERSIMVAALQAQRERFLEYLIGLGIDAYEEGY